MATPLPGLLLPGLLLHGLALKEAGAGKLARETDTKKMTQNETKWHQKMALNGLLLLWLLLHEPSLYGLLLC